MAMSLLVAKIVAMFGQVACLMFFCLLPIGVSGYVLKKGVKGEIFLSCCRCFGGGALLGSYMLHMSPEIRHLLESSLMEINDITYPVPEILAGFGFFFFVFVEWTVMFVDKKNTEKRQNTIENVSAGAYNSGLSVSENDKPVETSTLDFQIGHDTETSLSTTTSTPSLNHSNSLVELYNKNVEASGVEKVEDDDEPKVIDPDGGARSLIMLIALSADGLFQGLAIGLKTNNAAVWSLFIAVVGHEFVVAFCLGLELVRSQPTRTVVISGIVYGLTPALGTAIGITIMEVQGNSGVDQQQMDMVNGVLQSIATGVFLYVAFIGILGKEMTDHPGLSALLSVLGGYILMAALALLITPPTHDNHDHLTTAMPTAPL